jgi:hypothetical protein
VDEQINETLAGYARADEFLRQERMERLSKMTTEESRSIFAELVESASTFPLSDNAAENMLQWRLSTIVAVRRVFMQLAQVRGRI